jgi:iron complex transport system substrate-binding protein
MKSCRVHLFLLIFLCLSLKSFAVGHPIREKKPERIVSLNGTISEILCELGLQAQLVGVDVTSTYPEALQKLPKVGHSRNLSAEGILALRPTLILGTEESVKPEVVTQLKNAGIPVRLFRQAFSVAGTQQLIREVAVDFGASDQAQSMIARLETDLSKVRKAAAPRKVLFIYARGAGSLMVAGQGTSVEKVIELAGGTNAATGFDDFKPLTPEALIGQSRRDPLVYERTAKPGWNGGTIENSGHCPDPGGSQPPGGGDGRAVADWLWSPPGKGRGCTG